MSFELVAGIISFLSFLGMVLIIIRKIPFLLTLPEVPQEKKEGLISKIGQKIKSLNLFKNFSFNIFLQKVLTKIRILTLKTDHKTFNWLQKLRETRRKNNLDKDNYWEEVKKAKKEN